MQRGLDDWVGRRRDTKLHVAALAHAVTLVTQALERTTEKRWHEDAFTGEALRNAVEFLIFHFALTPDGTRPVPIPPRVEEAASRMPPAMRERARTAAEVGTSQAGMVITLIENAPASNKQPLGLAFPDEWGFWKVLRDLGSGWERNREAWKPKEARK
jgi:hypothetical protein